jgi:hypothetical protein
MDELDDVWRKTESPVGPSVTQSTETQSGVMNMVTGKMGMSSDKEMHMSPGRPFFKPTACWLATV